MACVAITAVNSDTIVPIPSMKAKPFTPAVARMNRMNAVINVTTLASMIAVEALLVAGRDPALDRRPRAISSFTRSKITMLASAATPIVRISPAIPGSVSVIGISSISAEKYDGVQTRAATAMRPSTR